MVLHLNTHWAVGHRGGLFGARLAAGKAIHVSPVAGPRLIVLDEGTDDGPVVALKESRRADGSPDTCEYPASQEATQC